MSAVSLHISTGNAHGDANISAFDSGSIIDTVHPSLAATYFTVTAQGIHNLHLVFGADARVDIRDLDDLAHFFFSRVFNIRARSAPGGPLAQASRWSSRWLWRIGVITRDHHRRGCRQ